MTLFLGCDYLDQITKSSWKTSKCNFVEKHWVKMSNCFKASDPRIDLSIVKTTMIGFIAIYLWNSHMNKLIQMFLKWFCVLAIDTFDNKQMKMTIGQYNANDYIKGFVGGGNSDLETYNEQNYLL